MVPTRRSIGAAPDGGYVDYGAPAAAPAAWQGGSGASPGQANLDANAELGIPGGAGVPENASGWKKAAPYMLRSCRGFCYVGGAPLFGLFLIYVGWMTGVNECPRNLDGILLWFGIFGVAVTASMYVDIPEYNKLLSGLRIALVVVMAILNLVGYLWSQDSEVVNNKWKCGHFLVFFSQLVWVVVPIGGLGYLGYTVLAHFRRLQQQDKDIHNDVIVT